MLQYPLANIKMLNTAIVKILQNTTTEPERSNKLKVIAVNFLNIILKLFLDHCDEQYCDLHVSEESSSDYTQGRELSTLGLQWNGLSGFRNTIVNKHYNNYFHR